MLRLFALFAFAVTAAAADPRPAWTTSKVAGSPEPPPPYKLVPAFPKLKFKNPVLLARMPGADRLFVAEQAGKIFSFKNAPDAEADLFADFPANYSKLKPHPGAKEIEFVYGLAFHPDFAKTRECFVCYTFRSKKDEKNLADGTRVSRFKVSADAVPKLQFETEEVLLSFLQGGHNGGDLHFGPDGMLYISTGDAADPNPPDALKTGQDVTDLLSSVLRIDVNKKDAGENYAIPADNPFVGLKIDGKPARGEVWAYGFRNPWRMSFDSKAGDLWVGDVGWEAWEMIFKAEKAGNYGWSVVEARQPVNTAWKIGPTPIKPPAIELGHDAAASITGGYVYRGAKFPGLEGKYVFGDWVTRRIWAATFKGGELDTLTDIAPPTCRVVAFGVDNANELYALDYDAGIVFTLQDVKQADFDPKQFPRTLGETGLFSTVKTHALARGVVPYRVAAPLWQDFSTAEHFIALPGTSSATDVPEKKQITGNVDWHYFRMLFPAGAVLGKTISLERTRGQPKTSRRVETQILHFDGENWHPYTYAWRDDNSDADLVPADGAEKLISVTDPVFAGGVRRQNWTFASRGQCMTCHNSWSEYAVGFSVEQLNCVVKTPEGPKNQLEWLCATNVLKRENRAGAPLKDFWGETAAKEPKLADLSDTALPVADRARSYLHANCAHCHRMGGGGSVDFELTRGSNLKNILDANPTRGSFDIPDAKVVAKGDAGRSVLYYRMAKFGTGRMPHLGCEYPDEAGLKLVEEWIRGLSDTPPPAGEFKSGDMAAVLANPGPARLAARFVADPATTPKARGAVYQAVGKLPAGPTRDLFEGYVSQGTGKIGSNPRPRAILALTGDPEKGKLGFENAGLKCLTCHRIDGKGADVGPDLTEIAAKRGKEHLLESLLEPSRRVDPAYQAYTVRTVGGETLTGQIVRKDTAGLLIRDANGKERRVAAADVESVAPSRQSLMPDGLLRELRPQEVAHLLAYLSARTALPAGVKVAAELGVPAPAGLPATVAAEFAADAVTAEEVKTNPEKYAVRAAVLAAAAVLRGAAALDEPIELHDKSLTDKVKNQLIEKQEDIAAAILRLQEAGDALAAADVKAEPSKRWRAHAAFQGAYLRMRLAALEELNFVLAGVRTGKLPALDEKAGQTGWKLRPVDEMSSQRNTKRRMEDARDDLNLVRDAHPNTPWAALAEAAVGKPAGLKWEPAAVAAPPAKPAPGKGK